MMLRVEVGHLSLKTKLSYDRHICNLTDAKCRNGDDEYAAPAAMTFQLTTSAGISGRKELEYPDA